MPAGNSQRDALLTRARVPSNHWDCLLSEIPNDVTYKDFVVRYTDEIAANIQSGKGLFLWGDYGTGKTGIAAIICKAALNKGYVPLWIAAEKLPDYMWNDDIYFDGSLLMRDRIFEVPLLVIDDLRLRDQSKAKTDSVERTLESVIRRRMDNTRPTIITSNNNPGELAKLKAVHAICCEAVEFVKIAGCEFRPDTPYSN